MRGDITIQTDTVTDLAGFDNIVVDGDKISGAPVGTGVKARKTQKSLRVSLPAAAVEAAGGAGPVRFVMTFAKLEDGGRVYRMIPAGDKPAHAVIKGRN